MVYDECLNILVVIDIQIVLGCKFEEEEKKEEIKR